MRRARHSYQKQERREAILAVAKGVLAELPYVDITMDAVAQRTGLVKGTLYLYFATKEELFLELLRNELHGWLWDLETGLELLPQRGRVAALAHLIAGTISDRPALRILLGLQYSVLEQNLPDITARAFRAELSQRIAAMGDLFEKALPFLVPKDGVELLRQILATAIGLQALTEPLPLAPSAAVGSPVPLPFEDAFQAAIERQLQGFRHGHVAMGMTPRKRAVTSTERG